MSRLLPFGLDEFGKAGESRIAGVVGGDSIVPVDSDCSSATE